MSRPQAVRPDLSRPRAARPDLHPEGAIAADTSLGTVQLAVSDLARARWFYCEVLGLQASEQDDGWLALRPPGADSQLGPGSADGVTPLLRLSEDKAAPALDRRAVGLFHVALLFPTRVALAHALTRVANARWPLDGASDHLVSEALYLSDPDGNGIELYRDRPRSQWPLRDGHIQMATLPLDLRGLLTELDGAAPDGGGSTARAASPTAPADTIVGHVHLQVSDLAAAEAFYHGVLGFDVTVRGYPGALFVSAGGYHHHLGLNTWNSGGAGPTPPGSLGLRSYEVLLPSAADLEQTLVRVRGAGVPTDESAAGVTVRDPSGNLVVLRSR